ncbi:MAG: enterochelin esterase [Acidobacteriota bacterium]
MKRLAMIAAFALLFCGFWSWLSSEAARTDFRLSSTGQVRTKQEPVSPRLSALRQELETGNRAALEQLWQEVASQGTPLVEPIQGDDRNVLVTFLWRAKEETKNVLVWPGLSGSDLAKNQMRRLMDTDLWHKTYRLPSDARFTYALSLNDSLVPIEDVDEKDIAKRFATVRMDPLNKRVAIGGGSIVELPGAPPSAWGVRQPEVPKGRIEDAKIKSGILKNERRAWVYTPPGYARDGKPYGLIVMFDGLMYTLLVPTPAILDNLLAKSKLPPMIAVILDNPTPYSRSTEFACSEPYAEFIAKEVIPWVRANYNVTTDPSQTVVCGVSFGGLAAAFVGFRHPEIFGNVISQSGSFWWKPDSEKEPEWLARQFATSKKLPLRFYLDVGLFETGPNPHGAPDMVAVNRHMRDVLRAKGYEVEYRECNCGHDYLNWRGMLPDALMALAGGSSNQKIEEPLAKLSGFEVITDL